MTTTWIGLKKGPKLWLAYTRAGWTTKVEFDRAQAILRWLYPNSASVVQ